MNLLSCTVDTFKVNRKRSGLELSRECLMVSDGKAKKL